jgi:polyhydroxyalkanoate synthesis regulator phasin
MAQADVWRKYIEAGMALTQLTQTRADALVRDLVRAGELRASEAQDWITELLERSRRDSEFLVSLVRREVAAEIEALGLVSRDELDAAEARLREAAKPARKAAPRKAAPRKAAATKAAATKAAPRKAAAKKAKAAPTKATAKTTTRKAPAAKAAPPEAAATEPG